MSVSVSVKDAPCLLQHFCRKNDSPLLVFGEMKCKERLSECGAKATHYGKICSLVTSNDKSGSQQIGTWGARHILHAPSHMASMESVRVSQHLPCIDNYGHDFIPQNKNQKETRKETDCDSLG